MRILGTITTLRSQAERVEAYTRAAGGEVLAGGHRELHVRLACSTSDTTHLQQHPDGALTAVDTHGPPIGPHLSASVAELTGLYLSGRWEQIAQSQQTIVIWDPGEGRLALIRDRLGVPPLFYSQDDHGITWSTEIRPLVELGASADPDLVALAGFQLTGFVMHPRTSVAGVTRWPPSHVEGPLPDSFDSKEHFRP